MADEILNEDVFPIVGWAGPGDAMIRADVMHGMADAGFTVSHSQVSGDLDDVVHALDVAAESGVRYNTLAVVGFHVQRSTRSLSYTHRGPHSLPADERSRLWCKGSAIFHLRSRCCHGAC